MTVMDQERGTAALLHIFGEYRTDQRLCDIVPHKCLGRINTFFLTRMSEWAILIF